MMILMKPLENFVLFINFFVLMCTLSDVCKTTVKGPSNYDFSDLFVNGMNESSKVQNFWSGCLFLSCFLKSV